MRSAFWGLVALAMAGAALALFQHLRDYSDTKADLKMERAARIAAEAELERAQEAAAVHRAHLERAEQESRRFQTIRNELQQMGGRDAPLSPLLRATAERLWPSE